MANLRKRQIKGTILLEALLALGVFAVIASLLLGQITQSRKEAAAILEKEEVLRVAQMALQTGQDHLSLMVLKFVSRERRIRFECSIRERS